MTRVQFLARMNFYNHIQNSSGAHLASYEKYTGVKWPEHEGDYSPPSSTNVKNMWRYTSTPP
jgi:hypothetical protein